MVESIVTAFTSLAQLVESTYMATHSSFFAMVGVADQLGSLKTYLGQVLGVFSILRLGRRLVNWLKGKKVRTDGWANEWSTAAGGDLSQRPSSKPLILFLLSAVGLPWLMSRLVKLLIETTKQNGMAQLADGGEAIDPSKLTFARARWEFKSSEEWELPLARDEIVAVLERRDPNNAGDERGWWRGRLRDGKIGWFPGNHVSEPSRRQRYLIIRRSRSYSVESSKRHEILLFCSRLETLRTLLIPCPVSDRQNSATFGRPTM